MYLNLRIIFNTDEMNPLCGIHSNNSVCIYPLVEVIQNVNSAHAFPIWSSMSSKGKCCFIWRCNTVYVNSTILIWKLVAQ